jgi:hypothetical protein
MLSRFEKGKDNAKIQQLAGPSLKVFRTSNPSRMPRYPLQAESYSNLVVNLR